MLLIVWILAWHCNSIWILLSPILVHVHWNGKIVMPIAYSALEALETVRLTALNVLYGIRQWLWRPGACLNIKMSSWQYGNSHYKDKTVSRPSYLYNGNPIPGKTVFILRRGSDFFSVLPLIDMLHCWRCSLLVCVVEHESLYHLSL